MNVSFSLTNIENVPMLLVQSRLCQMTDRQTDTHTHTHTANLPTHWVIGLVKTN